MSPRHERVVLASVAIVQAVIVLGPALRAGVAVLYDMPWSPDPRWTPFVLGVDTPAPRAVPGDAAAVLAGKILSAGLAQTVILLGILIGLALGTAALLRTLRPTVPLAGLAAAAVAAVWNPFVQERLVVGQWTVLLGLAVLPWAVRAGLRLLNAGADRWPLLLCVAIAGIGGANSLIMVLLPVVLLLGVEAPRLPDARRGVAAALVVGLGSAAVWALPSLASGAPSSGAGVTAFAPVADTPLGVILSLVSGGGFWNSASHPAARDNLVIAGTATVVAVAAVTAVVAQIRGRTRTAVLVAIGMPTAMVLISATPVLRPAWQLVVTSLPGGGLLRDSHKLMAPWVIAIAVGVGLLVDLAVDRRTALRGPLATLLLLTPIALSPTLAWGALGRVAAVEVPPGYRTSVEALNALPTGDVGLIPWNQYRRYEWNASRVSLTLIPRMVTHTVVFDDGLPLRSGRVPGESPRAAAVTAAVAAGQSPAEALADHGGVRYIVGERQVDGGLPDGFDHLGNVVIDTPELLVVEVNPELAPAAGIGAAGALGWLLTVATTVVVSSISALRRVITSR